ncbi:MAG: AsmA family protein [Deltaproteobacteria bacterium]|nr:AsmA family protein [Deltaproteobacteria bacterium]
MGKTLKWMGIIIGGLILLMILFLLIAPMFIDVQKYKPRIEEQVAEATGRSFAIGGDLKLSLFPLAGLAFSDLHLGNPEGFEEKDFIFIKSFDIQVKFLPLLSRDLQVKRFLLEGPRIFLEKKRDGRTNWEGLGGPSKEGLKGATEKSRKKGGEEPDRGLPIKGLAVGECAVRDGQVLWIDHAGGGRWDIKDINLELRDVSFERPIQVDFSGKYDQRPLSLKGQIGPLGEEPGKGVLPLDFLLRALDELNLSIKGQITDPSTRPQFDLALQVESFSPRKLLESMGQALPVDTRDPQALSRLALKCNLKGDPQKVSISNGTLDLDASKATFSGQAKDFSRPDLKVEMSLDRIDMDRYLPPSSGKKAAEPEASTGSPKKKTDYAPLRSLVLDAEIRLGEMKIQGAGLQDVLFKITGRNGLFDINPFSFKAYDGDLLTKAALDVREEVPRMSVNLEGKGLKINPLLKDVMKKDFLEGTTDAQVTLTMEGEDAERIKKTLNGKGGVQLKNGAVIGIDLNGMIRNVKASFGLAERAVERPRTDFAELIVPFSITGGVVDTPDTRLTSPLLRVAAAGKADLVRETLDFRIEPRFVATLKGQGDTKDRSGVLVPVLVRGTFASPKFDPDLKGMLKQQLEGGIPQLDDIKKMLQKDDTQDGGDAKSPKEAIEGLFKGLKIGK